MSFLSDSPQPAGSGGTTLTDVPLVGPAVGWLDAMLNDLGWPTAVNQSLELVLLGIGLYLAGRWFLARAVPWLTRFLVGPVNGLIDGVRAVLLLPDLAVARTARLVRARPPALLYSYGNAVLDTADRMQSAVRTVLPTLAVVSRWPGRLTFVALALAFVYWNTDYCTGQAEGRGCQSPAAQWVSSAKLMLDDEGDAAGKESKDSRDRKDSKEDNGGGGD